MLRCR